VIVEAVGKLPSVLRAEYEAPLESELVEHAHSFDPTRLATLARRLLEVIDPDGTLADDADHERQREFTLVRNRDGSATPTGRLTPALTAVIEAFLDEYAAPRPAVAGVRDRRTGGQRRHDAIADGFTRLLRGETGPGATLMLGMTAEQFVTGQGYVTTPHGGLLSVPAALDLISDGEIGCVLFDPNGGVMSYGRSRRVVSAAMRVAIVARDKGCTFPACDRPAAWAEVHHLLPWVDGGHTSIENCALVCCYHHREFADRGWQGLSINGRPHWKPPTWIDVDQIPQLNTLHDAPMRA
jgi:hypothetical protein